MMLAPNPAERAPDEAEDYVGIAASAVQSGSDWEAVLDAIPLPVYTTDAEGAVTYWNQACVDFAGREPELGSDRWCISWQLYSINGDPMPHDQCPMADAIRGGKAIRGERAIAMRPDGKRRAFAAYPTPLLDSAGKVTGAVNLLLDVSDEQAGSLSEQAARCRRLARATTDERASEILRDMASGYATTAAALCSAQN